MAAETAATPARVTAAEIQAALGITKQAQHKRATTGKWPFESVPRAVGGFEKLYPIATLPAAVRDALASRAITQAGAALALASTALAAPASRPGTDLALAVERNVAHHEAPARLKQVGTARAIVLGRVQALVAQNLCSTRRGCMLLLAAARSGELPHNVVALLQRARDRRGRACTTTTATTTTTTDGLPSLGSLQRWLCTKDAGNSLVPQASALPSLRVLGWHAPLFALCDRPQKPTLRWAHEQLLMVWRAEWASPVGSPPPSYHAAVRAYNKRSGLDQLKGRHSGSALRAKTFYHRRTYEGLAPFTEVHADGWCSHFTAPHPVTGEFRTVEVWHYRDVATRYVPPFAVGQTENTNVILDGLQRCIRVGGVMAVLQFDHTSSVKNQRVLDEHAGLAERLGISVVHPVEVGNSQANGMAENFNTWLDREARALATYQNPNKQDSATFVRVRRLTNAMVKAAGKPGDRAGLRKEAMRIGKGIVFDSYAEALAWLEEMRCKWNNHPCRALPRLRSEQTGRLVYMSPQQSLDAALAAGWQPVALNEAQLIDEFRPHVKKHIRRGTVTPYGRMRYHCPELAHHEGEEVLVAVDRENPEAVWVKALDGVLIAKAAFVPDVASRTQSMQEHSDAKRARAQIRRREQQIDAIEARMAPPALEMELAASWSVLDLPGVGDAAAAYMPGAEIEPSGGIEEITDPMEAYLRQRMAQKKVAALQAEIDDLARITAVMKKAAEQAAEKRKQDEQDERDFERGAGR